MVWYGMVGMCLERSVAIIVICLCVCLQLLFYSGSRLEDNLRTCFRFSACVWVSVLVWPETGVRWYGYPFFMLR